MNKYLKNEHLECLIYEHEHVEVRTSKYITAVSTQLRYEALKVLYTQLNIARICSAFDAIRIAASRNYRTASQLSLLFSLIPSVLIQSMLAGRHRAGQSLTSRAFVWSMEKWRWHCRLLEKLVGKASLVWLKANVEEHQQIFTDEELEEAKGPYITAKVRIKFWQIWSKTLIEQSLHITWVITSKLELLQ